MGATFVPFSSRIVAEALKGWTTGLRDPGVTNDRYFFDHVYTNLGYELVGNTAVLPTPKNPFASGNRSSWAAGSPAPATKRDQKSLIKGCGVAP
jgi:hypothetical protein